nr:T6SS effector amidase Tae4 family protein [Pseudoduganella umbonata]
MPTADPSDPIVEWNCPGRGKPEVVKYPAADGGPLKGKKGVILFEVSGWSDAQGHATLFDGRSCYDHCYFNEPEAKFRTDRANFWRLR